MVPSKNIEDQFTDAVNLALEDSPISLSPEITNYSVRVRRHWRAHLWSWFVVFIFTSLTVTLTMLFVRALLVRMLDAP